jgi:hypothetical protein
VPDNRQLPQSQQAIATSHACSGDTLRQVAPSGKKKFWPDCEETVDVETSLWKVKEMWLQGLFRKQKRSKCCAMAHGA